MRPCVFRCISHLPPNGAVNPRGDPRDEPTFGVFSGQHIKEFPVRAAIDIGTGGVISLCVARVDAARAAVRDVMYQTQLPLCLESEGGWEAASSGGLPTRPFTLSSRTCVDIQNKMTTLSGAMRRDVYDGLSERAAVLSWPICLAENAEQLAADLTREFKIDVRVLGKTFHVEWPFGSQGKARMGAGNEDGVQGVGKGRKAASELAPRGRHPGTDRAVRGEGSDVDEGEDGNSLRRLLQRASAAKLWRRSSSREMDAPEGETPRHSHGVQTKGMDASMVFLARAQVAQLAFLAHATLSRCVVPQRLLVIDEDPQRGLRLFGVDSTAAEDVRDILSAADDSPPEEKASVYKKALAWCDDGNGEQTAEEIPAKDAVLAPANPGDGNGLLEFRLPVDVAQAHRYSVVEIQRRDAASYHLHGSSPNPMLATEWASLCSMLERLITPTLPKWVRRKSGLGGVIAGTSFNGGMLNLAARVSQRMPISLDHLEVHAQHHFCGLTDVLLTANFPNPLLVLPSVALAAALMRALQTPRISYLPELSIAAALLTQPSLWIYERRRTVREALSRYEYHQSMQHRFFPRPHIKSNPTAAPNAVWGPRKKL
ncbi:unnamed protein product [Phytomonas sp. EM1]|nr:unnamed protein product [Phytomonas sp. EM1]|eukprot:CCW64006.1 unnamed protein product [Phytomonas sp. isolate EM1]